MEAQWCPNRHQNRTKCLPDPFQKQLRKQTPHKKAPNPENAYSCSLWHDFQGPQAPQMPTKTPPKITSNCKTCYKKRTRKTHENTCCKMMLPASKSMPKGSPFLSLGLSFSCHFASGCASCRPPGTRDGPDPQKQAKIIKKHTWNMLNS